MPGPEPDFPKLVQAIERAKRPLISPAELAALNALVRAPQTPEEAALNRLLIRGQIDKVLGPIGNLRLREIAPE